MTTRKTPAGLDARGRRFWRAIVDAYDPSDSELELLLETCRTLDLVERLEAAVKSRPDPDPKIIAEIRAQRIALGRLLAQLAIPAGAVESLTTLRARKAAQSRWAGHQKRGTA